MAETPELKRFLDEARELLQAAIALRRRIHQKPELGLNLPQRPRRCSTGSPVSMSGSPAARRRPVSSYR
jgi:hypothetical protein